MQRNRVTIDLLLSKRLRHLGYLGYKRRETRIKTTLMLDLSNLET